MSQGRIVKVSGPLVIAEGMKDANMFDVVRVSEYELIGEILEYTTTGRQYRFMRKLQASDREAGLYPPVNH